MNTARLHQEPEKYELNIKELDSAEKVDLSLIPPIALEQEALAYMAGCKKPGRWPYNWRNGGVVNRRTYLAAIMRHVQKDLAGEDFDEELSRLMGRPVTHLAAIRCCAGILLDSEACGTLVDDRPHNIKRPAGV